MPLSPAPLLLRSLAGWLEEALHPQTSTAGLLGCEGSDEYTVRTLAEFEAIETLHQACDEALPFDSIEEILLTKGRDVLSGIFTTSDDRTQRTLVAGMLRVLHLISVLHDRFDSHRASEAEKDFIDEILMFKWSGWSMASILPCLLDWISRVDDEQLRVLKVHVVAYLRDHADSAPDSALAVLTALHAKSVLSADELSSTLLLLLIRGPCSGPRPSPLLGAVTAHLSNVITACIRETRVSATLVVNCSHWPIEISELRGAFVALVELAAPDRTVTYCSARSMLAGLDSAAPTSVVDMLAFRALVCLLFGEMAAGGAALSTASLHASAALALSALHADTLVVPLCRCLFVWILDAQAVEEVWASAFVTWSLEMDDGDSCPALLLTLLLWYHEHHADSAMALLVALLGVARERMRCADSQSAEAAAAGMASLIVGFVARLADTPPALVASAAHALNSPSPTLHAAVTDTMLQHLSGSTAVQLILLDQFSLRCATGEKVVDADIAVLPWLHADQQVAYLRMFPSPLLASPTFLCPLLLPLSCSQTGETGVLSPKLVAALMGSLMDCVGRWYDQELDASLCRTSSGKTFRTKDLICSAKTVKGFQESEEACLAENWQALLHLLAVMECALDPSQFTETLTKQSAALLQASQGNAPPPLSGQPLAPASALQQVVDAVLDIVFPSPWTASELRKRDGAVVVALVYALLAGLVRMWSQAWQLSTAPSAAVGHALSLLLNLQSCCLFAMRKVTRHAVSSLSALDQFCSGRLLPSLTALFAAGAGSRAGAYPKVAAPAADEFDLPDGPTAEPDLPATPFALRLPHALTLLAMHLPGSNPDAPSLRALLQRPTGQWPLRRQTAQELVLSALTGACHEVSCALEHLVERPHAPGSGAASLLACYHSLSSVRASAGCAGVEGFAETLLTRCFELYCGLASRRTEASLLQHFAASGHPFPGSAFRFMDPTEDELAGSASEDSDEERVVQAFTATKARPPPGGNSEAPDPWIEQKLAVTRRLQGHLLQYLSVPAAKVLSCSSQSHLQDLCVLLRCEWLRMLRLLWAWAGDHLEVEPTETLQAALDYVGEELSAGLEAGITMREVLELLRLLATLDAAAAQHCAGAVRKGALAFRLLQSLRRMGTKEPAVLGQMTELVLRSCEGDLPQLRKWTHYILECVVYTKAEAHALGDDAVVGAMGKEGENDDDDDDVVLGPRGELQLHEALRYLDAYVPDLDPAAYCAVWADYASPARDLTAVYRYAVDLGDSKTADHVLVSIMTHLLGDLLGRLPPASRTDMAGEEELRVCHAAGQLGQLVQGCWVLLFADLAEVQRPLVLVTDQRKAAQACALLLKYLQQALRECAQVLPRDRGAPTIPAFFPAQAPTGGVEGRARVSRMPCLCAVLTDKSLALALLTCKEVYLENRGLGSALKKRMETIAAKVDQLTERLRQLQEQARRRGLEKHADISEFIAVVEDFLAAVDPFGSAEAPGAGAGRKSAAAKARKRKLVQPAHDKSRRNRNTVIDQWISAEDGEDTFADMEDFIVADDAELE